MSFKDQRRALVGENQKWARQHGMSMTELPPEYVAAMVANSTVRYTEPPLRAWRSPAFLAVLYRDSKGFGRLSINRTTIDNLGRWRDEITWDELMQVKEECGFGAAWAVELYPPVDSVVNDANMRHLFLLAEPPPFAWRSGKS